MKKMKKNRVIIVGGGLAGTEAAYQLAKRGIKVTLFEMRPEKMTPAHKTGRLAEVVCSNSFGSESEDKSGGLLKKELEMLNSLLIRIAKKTRVPAGHALAVDRELFSKKVEEEIKKLKNIEIIRKEIKEIPEADYVILATGPLTSESLAKSIMRITGRRNLYFYDATTPIVTYESINKEVVFKASRYDNEGEDYLNAPFTEEEYRRFQKELKEAETVPLKDFEKHIFFEACLPIEELAKRGEMTLAYGPLKPVGIVDPKTGKRPFAVVQLRQDNISGDYYQLVGFQTRLKWSEQKRIFRMIPGLENAEFVRLGVMHRNTFINSPLILNDIFEVKSKEGLFIVGQLSGLEGYVEAIASGLMTAIYVFLKIKGKNFRPPSRKTAVGSLSYYVSKADWRDFQPSKFVFGLMEPPEVKIKDKVERRKYLKDRALKELNNWIKKTEIL